MDNLNEKKTAEEMLKEYADNSYINSGSLGGSFNGLDRIPFVVWPSVVKIMQEYAAQETAALRDKLSALEMADNIMLKDLREQLNHEREQNERLKEALKDLLDLCDNFTWVEYKEQITARELLKADSQEQNRQ